MRARIVSVTARSLRVPLRDPFVIATATMVTTRAAEISVRIRALGREATGLGEAATLVPVTREDEADVLRTVERVGPSLVEREFDVPGHELAASLVALLDTAPVARGGIEVAILDACGRIAGLPLHVFVSGRADQTAARLTTDMTLPIAEPERMANLARVWWEKGFRSFKVKVGKDVDHDVAAIAEVHREVPGASYRIDANGGFSAVDAIKLAREIERTGAVVECYEQPCPPRDLDAMAEVCRAVDPPVIADESVATLHDLERVLAAHAADGVNLKIAKSGGLLAAFAIGRLAQSRGLPLMVGGMVETRLGMTAGAHLAAALGGVAFVDLDTAWLLADDPYVGGYRANGPDYELGSDPGLGIAVR